MKKELEILHVAFHMRNHPIGGIPPTGHPIRGRGGHDCVEAKHVQQRGQKRPYMLYSS